MYLVMKSASCSMYILVFFEYSNSIARSFLHKLASVGGAQPRDDLRLALPSFIGSPRSAGPQPRDDLQLALRSVLVPRQRLERREEHRPGHPPHRHLDQRGPVHLDRVGHWLAHPAPLLPAPAHRPVG